MMKTSPACLDPRFQRLKPAVQLADLGACLHQPLLDQRYHSFLKKSNRKGKVCTIKKVIYTFTTARSTVGLSYHRRQGRRPYSPQAGVTRPGLIAGALGPSVVSLNMNKTSSSLQPSPVSPGGGDQAQWYHPASPSSESGECLRHVGCYLVECVWGSRP